MMAYQKHDFGYDLTWITVLKGTPLSVENGHHPPITLTAVFIISIFFSSGGVAATTGARSMKAGLWHFSGYSQSAQPQTNTWF
jgi:hypothetical protein